MRQLVSSSFLFPFLLAGCGTGDPGNQVAGVPQARKAAVQTAELTGLYEGGSGEQRDQMCILDRGTGNARFGLVTWGANQSSCSGEGVAVRSGDTLRLTMEGDETCVLEAQIDGGNVQFPAQAGPGCSYYCGAGATLAGLTLEKTGGTAEDAMRATDLVGDPLCAGL